MQVPEAALYSQFVDRSVREVRLGLQLDNAHRGSRKRKVHDALVAREGVPRSPAQKVLEARFILGGDDVSYLASGLACIWSTVGAVNTTGEAELALAPASLYAPDAVNGIRQGLIRALERRNQQAQKEAPKVLPMLMRVLATVADFVPDVSKEAMELLRKGAVTSAKERATLLVLLRNLKLIMADAGDSTEDPETNLARRILKGSRAGSRESLERIRRLQAEEQKSSRLEKRNEADRKRYLDGLEGAKRDYLAANVAARKEVQRAARTRYNNLVGEANALNKELAEEMDRLKAQLARARESRRQAEAKGRAEVEAAQQRNASNAKEALETENELKKKLKEQRNLTKKARKDAEQKNQQLALKDRVLSKQTLKYEADLLKEREQCEKRIAQLTAALEKAKAKMVQEEEKNKKNQASIIALGKRQAASEKTCSDQLKRLEKEHADATGAVELVRKQNKDWQAELEKAKAALAMREQQLTDERLARAEQLKAWEAKEADLEAELAKLRMYETNHEQRIEELKKCEAALGKAKRELWDVRAEKDEQIQECKRATTKFQTELDACLADAAQLRTLVQQVQGEMGTGAAELKQLKDDLAAKEAEAAAKQQQIDAAQAQLAQAVQTKDARIAILEKAKLATTGQYEIAQASLEQAEKDLAQCDDRYQTLLQQSQEAAETYAEQEVAHALEQERANANAAMQEALDYKDEKIAALQDSFNAQLDAQAAQSAKDCEEAKEALRQATEAALSDEIAQAKGALQAAQQNADKDRNRMLAEQAAAIAKVMQEKQQLRDEHAATEESLKAEIAASEEELQRATKAVDEFEKMAKQATQDAADIIVNAADAMQAQVDQADKKAAVVAQKAWLANNVDKYSDDTDATQALDSFSQCAVVRGLVGQRGPTEPASEACAHDGLLPYAMPDVREFVKRMVPVRSLLEGSADPSDDELAEALQACARHCGEPKRQRTDACALEPASSAVVAEALSSLDNDYAITGPKPASELSEDRCGVEVPHQVRWMPQGMRAETMARVAVLEHAMARCQQVAEHTETGEEVALALLRARAALKFRQMGDLYALDEAAAFDDDPHPLGTEERLVTRPCAMVRGVLSYPTDPGVQRIAEDRASENALTDSNNLKQVMSDNAMATATLRNELRRQGHPSHFYVAPPADQLAFVPAPNPTGGLWDKVKGAVKFVGQLPVDVAQGMFGSNTPDDGQAAQVPRGLPVDPVAGVQVVDGDTPGDATAQVNQATTNAELKALEEQLKRTNAAAREAVAKEQAAADEVRRAQASKDAGPGVIERAVRALRERQAYKKAKEAELRDAREFQAKARREALRKQREERASERLRPSDYSTETWGRIINRAIVAASALAFDGDKDAEKDCPDATAAFLEMNKSPRDGAGEVTAQGRRDGLWAEMHRHLAISQDRLWVFLRLLSGGIGGDVTEVITMANEATLKASKAIQEQRTEIAKRVSDMQSKIVETVVASMLKNSSMTMDYKDDGLAVVDAEARKNLRDLAAGTSARPFFEANVALKNLTESPDAPPTLKDVLAGLANVGVQMQSTLEQTLSNPGTASASLVELSHPSNAYFVSMRADAVAAIRSAHEMLNSELGAAHSKRRLTLWELVEGGCQVLTRRFAELCGFLLVQARTSTGVSAMYVSHQSIYTNASQARVALAKLLTVASLYANRVVAPQYGAVDVQDARGRALVHGERIADIDLTRPRVASRESLYAPISASGYWVVGARQR